MWWQLRTIGRLHCSSKCPFCPDHDLIKHHATQECGKFAELCWAKGIRPEEALEYPPDLRWVEDCLLAASELATAVSKQKAEKTEVEVVDDARDELEEDKEANGRGGQRGSSNSLKEPECSLH